VDGFTLGAAAGRRAAELGHEASIEHDGPRFRVVCSCGWHTNLNWTRKHVFLAVTEHVRDVIAQEGEFGDTPEDMAGIVGGRA